MAPQGRKVETADQGAVGGDRLADDEKAGRVYFTATKDDVLATGVYALNLADPYKIERLGEPGFAHGASMDKAG